MIDPHSQEFLCDHRVAWTKMENYRPIAGRAMDHIKHHHTRQLAVRICTVHILILHEIVPKYFQYSLNLFYLILVYSTMTIPIYSICYQELPLDTAGLRHGLLGKHSRLKIANGNPKANEAVSCIIGLKLLGCHKTRFPTHLLFPQQQPTTPIPKETLPETCLRAADAASESFHSYIVPQRRVVLIWQGHGSNSHHPINRMHQNTIIIQKTYSSLL